MKKQKIELPRIIILPDDGPFDFLKGTDYFAEKNARAREALEKIKIPAR
jgi:hypothetical protein